MTKQKKSKDLPPPSDAVAVRNHPRAQRAIAAGKGWGTLLGLTLVGLFAYRAGVPAYDAALRAVVGGVVGLLMGWAVTLFVWRHLVVAEIAVAERALAARAEAEEPAET